MTMISTKSKWFDACETSRPLRNFTRICCQLQQNCRILQCSLMLIMIRSTQKSNHLLLVTHHPSLMLIMIQINTEI